MQESAAIRQRGPTAQPSNGSAPVRAAYQPPLALMAARCCICGRRDADPVAVAADFEYGTPGDSVLVRRCRRCRVLYLDPRPTLAELPRIYPPSYHAFHFSADSFRPVYGARRRLEAQRLLRWCRGLRPDARIIDVGCGDGFHLRLLREFGQAGWTLEGVEPSVQAADAARRAGLTVHRGVIQSLELPAQSYDLAMLVHVLEHMDDPVGALTAIRRLLRPGGRLIVVTDNTDTIDSRLFEGRHWGGYHAPRHFYLFDRASLRALLEKTGFEAESLTYLLSPVNWVYSMHNALRDWGAPRWLVNRFSLTSPVSLAVFSVVDGMRRLAGRGALLHAVARRPPSEPTAKRADAPDGARARTARRPRAPVAVIGAGIAGLVAARELRDEDVPVIVYEAGKQVAGLAKSFPDKDGFTNDLGAHFITNRLAAALGVASQCRDVRHYSESVWLGDRARGYPLGLALTPRFALSALVSRARGRGAPPASAAEWFRAEYGDKLAQEVAIPLVEQWSGAPATELAPSVGEKLAGGVLHVAKLKLAARLTRRAVAHGYCREQPERASVWHVYPENGVGTLCEHLADGLGDRVRLESPVEAIHVDGGRVVAVRSKGVDQEVSAVMSTAPVNVLARLVQGTTALQHLARFRYRPMVLVNLRLQGRGLLPDIVLWTPEDRYPFFRITEAPLSMPWLAPEGKTHLQVDIGCEVGDAIWKLDDGEVARLCLDHLESIVPGIRRRFIGQRVMRTPIAYPVFLNAYEDQRRALERSTGVEGLYSIGRNGEFAHILMEDVYWRTLRRTQELVAALS